MNRRDLLKGGAAAAAVLGANDRIVVGVIGAGGRGAYEIRVCLGLPDVEVAAVAEVYEPVLRKAVAFAGGRAQGYQDFRRILDRRDIDAVFVSTPDHWHAPATLLAFEAGKDVYCEKPLSHTVVEGRRMVEAARRHRRVGQTGSQQRSAPHYARVVELIRGGRLGKITSIEAWNYSNGHPEGIGRPPDEPPPHGLDWDLYLGPAPLVPFNRNRFVWNYRWFWDYSGGMMTDWGAHHFDIIHWAMNVEAPLRVSAAGGKLAIDDNRETPDTFHAVFEYPGFVATYTHRLLNARRQEGRPYGILFHGTDGSLVVDRAGYEVFAETRRGENRLLPRCEEEKQIGLSIDPTCQIAHVRNFFDCVRSRRLPVADFEIGHRAVTACHLGVIAYQVGRKIAWDRDAETIPDDPPAAALLTKTYRKPWTLPA
jgi:predicted dehydrogenase